MASRVAEEFLSELNTEYIKRQLMEFPGKIVAKKAEARKLREAVSEADQGRAMLEAMLTTDIADEVDPNTGKARYSNEKARAAELMKRKVESVEYQEARKEARRAQFALSGAEDELAALVDKFKAMRYVARLVSAELELLAGDDLDGEDEDEGGSDEVALYDNNGKETGRFKVEQPY